MVLVAAGIVCMPIKWHVAPVPLAVEVSQMLDTTPSHTRPSFRRRSQEEKARFCITKPAKLEPTAQETLRARLVSTLANVRSFGRTTAAM